VSLWHFQENNKWQLDVEDLESLIRPNTKMILLKYRFAFERLHLQLARTNVTSQ